MPISINILIFSLPKIKNWLRSSLKENYNSDKSSIQVVSKINTSVNILSSNIIDFKVTQKSELSFSFNRRSNNITLNKKQSRTFEEVDQVFKSIWICILKNSTFHYKNNYNHRAESYQQILSNTSINNYFLFLILGGSVSVKQRYHSHISAKVSYLKKEGRKTFYCLWLFFLPRPAFIKKGGVWQN